MSAAGVTSPSTLHELKTLVLSFHPVLVIETVEEERVRALLRAASSELDLPLFEWSLTRGLARLPAGGAVHGTSDPAGLLRHLGTLTGPGIFHLKDFAPHLSQAVVTRAFREVAQQFVRSRSTLVLTGSPIALPPEVEHKAVRVPFGLPDREALRGVLESVVRSLRRDGGVEVDLPAAGREAVLDALSGLTVNQARQAIAYAALEDGRLHAGDVPALVRRKAQMIEEGGVLEYLPPEDNRFELGGFGRLRGWLDRARVGFTPQARDLNLRPPRGVLIVGVQGCGKSLAARYVARAWQLPLLRLDAGRLYDRYVGESERNFRRAVELAETMAPAVLWIDEIEKGFAPSASDADSGLSRRLFGAFLTWLQERRHPVFVVASANDLDGVPPELLRKGRFDEIFFVDLPEADERDQILRIHLQIRRQDPSRFDLAQLVTASEGFSGAEIEQAVIAALYGALHESRPLDTAMLARELGETVPLSVTRREQIAHLRETARGRFVTVR